MEFVTHRIIFVPSKELSARAIKLASEISDYGETYFRIDDTNYYSHLTVYKAEFPAKNEKKVFEALEHFVSRVKPFNLSFKSMFTEKGWTGMGFERAEGVYGSHQELVNLLNPLREGHIREKYFVEMKKNSDTYSLERQEGIQKFGYPEVMDEYRPHLTLVRFKAENVGNKVVKDYENKDVLIDDSIVDKIAVVKGGGHGTVTEYVKRFKLRG